MTAHTETRLRKAWTVEECDRVMSSGIDLSRYELLDGDLVEKMPKKNPHVYAVLILTKLLRKLFGEDERVLTEAPLHLSPTRAPEPDITVLNRSFAEIVLEGGDAGPSDALLVIEVADSSVETDLGPKAAWYASAGVTDYWVLDIPNRRFVIHREPLVDDGIYHLIINYREQDVVSPLAAPLAQIKAADALLPLYE